MYETHSTAFSHSYSSLDSTNRTTFYRWRHKILVLFNHQHCIYVDLETVGLAVGTISFFY